MNKKCKVIMLESLKPLVINNLVKCIEEHIAISGTFKKGSIVINHNPDLLNRKWQLQHLYITSDDEIQEGDWCMGKSKGYVFHKFGKVYKTKGWKKIIATTNSSLLTYIQPTGTVKSLLPHLPQAFIEKYVEMYNKDQQITDVMVEYEEYNKETNKPWLAIYAPKENIYWNPKVNPKDNTITINLVKDSWNREEVKGLVEGAYHYGRLKDVLDIPEFEKWLESKLL